MYREEETNELARRVADYIEDRSYGNISAQAFGDSVLCSVKMHDFEISTIVYDEQDAPVLHCDISLSIDEPSLDAGDYLNCLDGHTLVDGAWYDLEEKDDGELTVKLLVDDYVSRGPDDVASLAAINLIPVMNLAAK